jgi:hypothetical protein
MKQKHVLKRLNFARTSFSEGRTGEFQLKAQWEIGWTKFQEVILPDCVFLFFI